MIKAVDHARLQQIRKLFLKARARITETHAAVDAIVDELEGVLEVVPEDQESMAGGSTVTEWISEAVWNSDTTDEMLKHLDVEVKE